MGSIKGKFFWVMLNLVVFILVDFDFVRIGEREIIGWNIILLYENVKNNIEILKE